MIFDKNSLTFINHASIMIKGKSKTLLTDPWYQGEAFHAGWKLIVENNDKDIVDIIKKLDFIWISHEHPDHFSIHFLKKFKQQLLKRKVCFFFQQTKDKRVLCWLLNEGFEVKELVNNSWFEIESNFKIKVIKDEFYDSALIAEVDGIKIFNLNDCPIYSKKRIQGLQKKHGYCDILLTQFSYAAWKGGRKNKIWREMAAQDKLQNIADQANTLNAKIVIPFASFVRFSNKLNSYLNDSINHPQKTFNFLKSQTESKCLFMAPFDQISLDFNNVKESSASLAFWETKFRSIGKMPLNNYLSKYDFSELALLYKLYLKRVKKNNHWGLILFIGKLRLFGAFQPVTVRLIDLNISILINIINQSFTITSYPADVEMHSESLAFILKNPFGFDTLTVNGCFEELNSGGFTRFTKVFALENLNVLGYPFNFFLIFNVSLIFIFFSRIASISKRLVTGSL